MSFTEPAFADTELANDMNQMDGLRSMPPTERPKPVRVTFPDTELVNARRARAASIERQRTLVATLESLRVAEAAAAAYRNGKLEGDRYGFQRGWKGGTRWGISVGAFAMLVVGAIALAWINGRLPF